MALIGAVGAFLVGRSDGPPASWALETVWEGRFQDRQPQGFVDAPWNFEGNGPPIVEAAPGKSGEDAARFTLVRGARRQEIVAGVSSSEALAFAEGDDRYFAFSTRFAPNFPTVRTWQVIAQWKSTGDGSPPVGMFAGSHGAPRIQLGAAGWPGGGSDQVLDLGPLERGKWIDWVVHIKFSARPQRSLVEVWRDGSLVARSDGWRPSFRGERAGSRGGTLRAGRTSYLKVGLYRDPGIAQTARWWTREWTVSRPR
ncbi:MAG TPA: heparin lyase I family protein [Solirubrobacteraceae bacterium]|nr:heparin lyase I family protein [Solirubrobacteraceae bacterium]